MSKARSKRDIHGVLLLDKPAGLSSNQALQKVRWLFRAKKAGHTGSLDPIATGLLPICFGQATKVSSYLLGSDKKYTTKIKLGVTTDTLDREGQVLDQRPVDVSEAQLQAALQQFRGEIKQTPPMYSALKKDGQPLYKLARQGIEIERPERDMTVHELTATRLGHNHVELKVNCSSGFYIRSLAQDLGEVLGCGAHVVELRRTAIKDIQVESAVTLDELELVGEPSADINKEPSADLIKKWLQPTDALMMELPKLDLTAEQVTSLYHGRPTNQLESINTGLHRFYTPDNKLFAVGTQTPEGLLKTDKIFTNSVES